MDTAFHSKFQDTYEYKKEKPNQVKSISMYKVTQAEKERRKKVWHSNHLTGFCNRCALTLGGVTLRRGADVGLGRGPRTTAVIDL